MYFKLASFLIESVFIEYDLMTVFMNTDHFFQFRFKS